MKKLISIVTPCFNEEVNIADVHGQVRDVMAKLPQYDYEHIFIDNASTDATPQLLTELAASDRRVKVIFNSRNFGPIRSPYHGLMQASGDAAILLVADLQDPPELILEFVAHWERGVKMVKAVKSQALESRLMYGLRTLYYNLVNRLSNIELTKNFTGFGLYDRKVLETLREIKDPYPYLRGLVSEIGLEEAEVHYTQPRRKRGITKNNFYVLYDFAMLGITNHSKVPLRLATMLGFMLSAMSFIVAIGYFIAKLVFWNYFSLGYAPLVLGVFFLGSVQLFSIGILGEYIASIHTKTLNRPLVIEKARLNF